MTRLGPLTIFRCDGCGVYWMTRLLQDAPIECPRCHRGDTWTARWQGEPEPVAAPDPHDNPWWPWEDPEAYFNARQERMP
jgi:hypothetical protein